MKSVGELSCTRINSKEKPFALFNALHFNKIYCSTREIRENQRNLENLGESQHRGEGN